MTHASLFNGIGGFQLAAEWMGWENIMSCEINDFCNTVSKDNYPNCTQHHDTRNTDFTIYRGRIDVLSGGFPCQPFSVAGKQLGTEDERYLWPEMLRAVREISPSWVVGENVLGLVNWNGGLVFEQVQADLEAEGYEVQPFILPAAGVNATHRRYRVWFVAHSNGHDAERYKFRQDRQQERTMQIEKTQREWIWDEPERINASGSPSDPSGTKSQRSFLKRSIRRKGQVKTKSRQFSRSICTDWQNFPTQSPVCDGNDGLPDQLVRQRIREDSMGYLSEKEIDKIISEAHNKWRKETIKAGGNAIVPQVAYQIFKALEQYESLNKN